MPRAAKTAAATSTAPQANVASEGSVPKSAKTVTVLCKIPMGLRLQLQREVTVTEQSQSGARQVKQWTKDGPVHIARGPSRPQQPPPGYRPPILVGGYALTRGIPADFWAQWLEQNKQADYVVSKQIIAMASIEGARDAARDHHQVRSGLEPLVPDDKKDPRVPKPIPGVGQVTIADEMRARLPEAEEEPEDDLAEVLD